MRLIISLLYVSLSYSANLRLKNENLIPKDDDDINISPDLFAPPSFKESLKSDEKENTDLLLESNTTPQPQKVEITDDMKMGWNNWKTTSSRFQQVNEVPKIAGVQYFTNIEGFYKK